MIMFSFIVALVLSIGGTMVALTAVMVLFFVAISGESYEGELPDTLVVLTLSTVTVVTGVLVYIALLYVTNCGG